MARGTYQAGSVSVNLNANSAQYVQAMQKAQQITQACLGNMSNAFKQYAGMTGAALVGTTRAVASMSSYMAGKAAWAGAGLATYTGIVIAHRLEQHKLAIQYGVTAEQMNQVAYLANYAGVEAEDLLDAMKEISIKAGDVTEAGGAITNTMSAFYKAAGGADKWEGETSPVTKINNLRIAFQKLSDSDKIRVLDEMGDAGLRANGILQLTNEQFDMLQKTGAATATAANMQNVQELIAKFGYLQQIGNDFLMGVIGRLSPVFSKVVDEWTQKLKDAFEKKGGFKEGFQSYVDDWADKIFKFLMDTISSVAKFLDTLSNIKFDVLSSYNTVKGLMPGYTNVSATYDKKDLTDEQIKSEEKLDKLYAERDKIDRERVAREQAIRAKFIKENGGASGITDTVKQEIAIGNLIKTDEQLGKINSKLDEARTKIEPLSAARLALNAEKAVNRNDKEYQDLAKENVIDPATKAFNDTMKNKPKEDDTPKGKGHKGKGLTQQVYDASQSGAAAKQSDNWDAFNKKLQAQREKVLEIMKTYNTKELSEVEKREADEKEKLNDAYKGMKDIVTDYYADKLKTLNKNSPAYVQATKEMNDKVKKIEEERNEAVKQLDESQMKRRILDLNNMTKQFERQKKAMARQYGYGEKETEWQAKEREAMDQYDQMLDEMRKQYGKHLDDKNSMEYQKFKELEDEKESVRKKIREAEMDAFWDQQTAQDTIGNFIAQMKGKGESPFPGMSNESVKNAKGNLNEQIKMSTVAGGQMLDQAAKHSKKAFDLQKKINLASATMAMFTGVVESLKWGWPMGPIFAGLTLAMGLMNIQQIKSQQWQGQAHDGIDYVPNEGTWNLQKGERVMGAALNQDMTQFLKDNKDGKSKGGITLQYHQTVQGNVITNDEYENDLMERNANYMYSKIEEIRQDRGL